MAEHYRLYEGYVRKYNELAQKLHGLQKAGYVGADSESLKVDLTYALGAVKNHELFFDVLGGLGQPEGPLADAINASFHNIAQYLADLKQTAILGRGWAWTAYDLDHGTLFNYAGARNGIPVWNTVPLVAVDLYGHAYFYDYGENKSGYIDAVLKCINWTRVGTRFDRARTCAGK
jgi:Fe-Mn family superoxide dismutase